MEPDLPRVTPREHLDRRKFLATCWDLVPQFFTLLPVGAQWELHRFYGPSLELTDAETLKRIQAAAMAEPSLPQKVGRHYAVISDRYVDYTDRAGKVSLVEIGELLRRDIGMVGTTLDFDDAGKEVRGLIAHGLARPEPDYRILAKAFLSVAELPNERAA
jgi:hypothetical protein